MSTLFDLTGKTAFVTGGSKGLGKAMARAFAEHGADVFINSRHEDELRSAIQEITEGTSVRGAYAVADLSRREESERLAQAALAEMGKVDILVNNAGSNRPQSIDEVTDEDWDNILELNFSSYMALSRALVPPDEGAPLGPHHSHQLDHGAGLEGGAEHLLGHQSRVGREWPARWRSS